MTPEAIAAASAQRAEVSAPAGVSQTSAAFPSQLPSRTDPVWGVVGPPAGAVPARPVPPGELIAPAPVPPPAFPWQPVAALVAVAVVLVGLVILLSSQSNHLPGAPGASPLALLAVVVVAAVAVAAARWLGRRGETDGGGFSWRRLLDSRVIGSVIATLLLVAAWILLSAPGGSYTVDPRELPGQVSGLIQQAVAKPEPGYPRIIIRRVGIDLLLVKGDGKTPPVKYEAFTYPHADHLLDQQGIPGNSYVYAHARDGMFWNLHNLRIGDEVVIDYGGGKVLRYHVSQIHPDINWKDFRWLQPTSDDRLTLQTCNGWRDDDPRFIVVAERASDTKTALAR